MHKELMMMKVDEMRHAPWNPRTEAELEWDHPAMAPLIASVRAVGVVQPIAVWLDAPDMDDDAVGLVIAGNRRLEAAKAAGLKVIPAYCFREISEAQAREITRVENEVRLGISPLKDAELIGSMLGLSYSQKEIAAHFGVSEATICRRAKLLSLIPEIREHAASGDNLTADALERIALFPPSTQRDCLKAITRRKGTVRWVDVSWDFNQTTRDLDTAQFDKTQCLTCGARSGALGDLWGEMAEGDELGRCLCVDCFKRKAVAAELERVKTMAHGAEMVNGADLGLYAWNVRGDDRFADKKSKKHCALWYWKFSVSGAIETTIWGPSRKSYEADERRREIDRAREREEREAIERAKAERAEERDALYQAWRTLENKLDETYSENVGNKGEKVESAEWIAETILTEIKCPEKRCAIAKLLTNGEVEYCNNDVLELMLVTPKLREEAGITTEQLAEYFTAKKALDDFDAELEKLEGN